MRRSRQHIVRQPSRSKLTMRVQFSAGTDRLTWAYPTLSRQLKKCASYILERPSEVATLSMRQVAIRAGVPPSTMNRLARALGFKTYNEFRDVYRNSINNASEDRSQKAYQLQATVCGTDLEYTLDAFQQTALINLNALFEQLDRTVLDRAARALAGARRVLVVGMQESHSAANYLHSVAAMGFPNWHLVAQHNGEYPCLLTPLTGDDMVVAISFQPWAIDTIRVARYASEHGARVVGITDLRTSPLAACSDDILLVPIRSPTFFQSYVAATAVVEVLVGIVVAHGGPSVIEGIDQRERYRREMGAYWQA